MKGGRRLYWIATGLMAAFMLMASIPDILRISQAVDVFTHLGYPTYLLPFLGIAKTLAVLAIVVPGARWLNEWAYAGLIFNLVGAFYSHLSVGDPPSAWAFPLIGLGLVAGSYVLYRKQRVGRSEKGEPASDEREIRGLLEHWAGAVQAGNLDGVLRNHADDIVMFDVPPPERGVRGLQAYRESWPPFFRWLQQGGMFEIDALEVTAGDDVAFAHALLRCGTQETLRKHPDKRLRLTAGLRKTGGRWLVAHEHHSFTLDS